MNKVEIYRNKLKSVLKTNSWVLWVIPLFIIVSFTNGIETGLYISGIMISGISLGAIIRITIGAILEKYDLIYIYGKIIIFVISTTLLWMYLHDKKLLTFMIPFSIPLIILGLLDFRK